MNADLVPSPCPTFSPEDIVREVKHLPSAPKVLPRLKLLLRDGDSPMHEIVSLVRLDPGLATRVLQVANSAYFRTGLRCATVDEAVHRVGYEQVYELVSYAVSTQVLNRKVVAYGIEADELWRISVACALAAEVLAERAGEDRPAAYTAGLLHGLGMIAIDEWALHTGRNLTFTPAGFPRDATESERAQLGFTHAEAGAVLLQQWDFPVEMIEPVRWQYTPRASARHTRMACLLYAAKWVRSTVCARTIADRPAPPAASHLVPLGIGASGLAAITPFVARRLQQVSAILEAADDGPIDRGEFPGQRWRD